MNIRKALPADLPAIQELTGKFGMPVSEAHINNRDISLVARATDGSLVGFLFCGLMAKNTTGYIDKFCVDPTYRKKGVGNALAMACLSELAKRKVRSAFGLIKQDEAHDASAINALKMAMGSDGKPYTYVHGDVLNTIKELKGLTHGR